MTVEMPTGNGMMRAARGATSGQVRFCLTTYGLIDYLRPTIYCLLRTKHPWCRTPFCYQVNLPFTCHRHLATSPSPATVT